MNENENENENENKNENENENENEDEDKDEITKILISSYEDYDDDEINNRIKKLNDQLDKIIGKSKSFEDQIKSIKKVENLSDSYRVNDSDDKKLKFKIFKLKLPYFSNKIHEDSFKKIFCHKFETLPNKLINATKIEENQIIIKNIKKNKDELFKTNKYNDWVNQPNNKCLNLKDAITFILDFTEKINYIWFECIKNMKIKK